MPRICYTPKKFNDAHEAIILQANTIFLEYVAAGYTITLRQLYYQFVSRDLFPESWADPKTGSTNNVQSYKKLGSIINDARLAGRIDWNLMEDRTRNLKQEPSWSSPEAIIQVCADTFVIDKWATQPCRPEVWIEKDALAGVFERVCNELQIPYFSCRGYTSQSEMWSAARRMAVWNDAGQLPVVLHFGDHDPSGIDMSRDVKDRLNLFGACGVASIDFRRLALNMDQVEQYDLPPNPAKVTDSRADSYIRTYSDQSWELDAIPPEALATLVREAILGLRDEEQWDAALEAEASHRRLLREVSENWQELTENL